jgi:hypothetical protein
MCVLRVGCVAFLCCEHRKEKTDGDMEVNIPTFIDLLDLKL